MRESTNPTGRLTLRLVDPRTGRVERELRVDNLVTLSGRLFLARLLRLTDGVALPTAVRIAVGGPDTGATNPPTLQDVALQNQRLAAAATVDEPLEQTIDSTPRIVATVAATFEPNTAPDPITLTEAGVQLTYADGSTVLYNRVTFPEIIKAPLLRLELSWEVVF